MPPLVNGLKLDGHLKNTRFRTSDVDELAGSVAGVLGGKLLRTGKHRSFTAHADYFKLPQTELWFCSYDISVSLLFSEGDFFRVQFRSAGTGATETVGQTIPVAENTACISAYGATIHFEEGFEQIVWRIPREVIIRKLTALTGLPVTNELVFNPILDLSRRNYDTLSHLLECVIDKIQAATDEPNRLVLAEMEQAMLVALLCQSEHNWRSHLDGEPLTAAPWQVKRTEEYIAEHWNHPLDIADLAAYTGASVRSIFRSFQKFRGCTPGEFIRRQRLIHARNMLLNPSTEHSIAEIAAACGFSDGSHFAKEFDKAFGEKPSVLRRHR